MGLVLQARSPFIPREGYSPITLDDYRTLRLEYDHKGNEESNPIQKFIITYFSGSKSDSISLKYWPGVKFYTLER